MADENLTVTQIDAHAVDDIIKDQYLAAELDEVIRMQKYAKEVGFLDFSGRKVDFWSDFVL
jgi:hypothetical protein